MSGVLICGATNVLELAGVRNQFTGNYLPGATVTCTVYDAAGATVDAGAIDIACGYVANTRATFRGILPGTVPLVGGHRYRLRFTVVVGSANEPVDLWVQASDPSTGP